MNYNVIKKIFPLENCNNIKNLKYDSEGLWSISHPDTADDLSKKIKLFEKSGIKIDTILDLTAGLGGNTLSFCKFFKKVISIEYDEIRFEYLKNNISNYNFSNIQIYKGNSIELLNNFEEKIDAIFVDPPWGGPNYKDDDNLEIKLSDLSLDKLCNLLVNYSYLDNKVKIIVLKLPYNYDYSEILNNCKESIKLSNSYKVGNINYLMILVRSVIEKEI
jgi:precorrin-6B methylase 2